MKAKSLFLTLLFITVSDAVPRIGAAESKVTKFYAQKVATHSYESGFGGALAMSDRWIIAGQPGNDDVWPDAGAVHIYNATTGAHVRKVVADDVPQGRHLGTSVAVRGNLVVVGAPFDEQLGNQAGAVYLFDASTGKQVRKITASDGTTDCAFGYSVAISGNLILVGAPYDNAVGIDSGAAYVYDATTGTELKKLIASDAAGGHYFGGAVALSGRLAVVGANQANGAAAGSGAAYVFDALAGGEVHKLAPTVGAFGDGFGAAVAIDGMTAMIGAAGLDVFALDAGGVFFFNVATGLQVRRVLNQTYGEAGEGFGHAVALSEGVALASGDTYGDNRGAAYTIDLRSGEVGQQILASDGQDDVFFGSAIALHNNRAVIGASSDHDKAPATGAAYLYHSVSGTLPTKTLARGSNFAPGSPGSEFSVFGKAAINSDGDVTFDAMLKGPGSNGGKDQGYWRTLPDGDSVDLSLKTRDLLSPLGADFAGVRSARLISQVCHLFQSSVVRSALMGTGVTPRNNQVLFLDNMATMLPIVRTGVPQPLLANAEMSGFKDVVQNRNPVTPLVGLAYQLRLQSGLVTADKDSGLAFASSLTGALADVVVREGTAAPGGGTFGQVPGRLALVNTNAVFPSFRINGGAPVQCLFQRVPGVSSTTVVDAGVVAPGVAPATFKQFFAEGVTYFGDTVLRASLSGTGVNVNNNEGLWHQGVDLIARENDQVPGEATGVRWSRFVSFWPASNSGMVFLAQLRGPGITTANSMGLWYRQENGDILRLARQGDFIASSDGARIKTIQRVDVEPLGRRYALLVSLTGAAGRNQALLTGALTIGNPTDQRGTRLPVLKLRKGHRYEGAGNYLASSVRSLSMSPATTAGGAGGTGIAQSVSMTGGVPVRVVLDNNVSELISHREITLTP